MKNQEKSEIIRGIGERVRTARLTMGYKRQVDFGLAMGGLTLDQVSRAERGLNLPPAELIIGMAAHGVNANWIMLGEGPMMRGEETPVGGRQPPGVPARAIPIWSGKAAAGPLADAGEEANALMAQLVQEMRAILAELQKRPPGAPKGPSGGG